MKRVLLALCAASLPGCFGYLTADGSAGAYFSIPIGPPAPIQVSAEPPPPRYETQVGCGYGMVWVAGRWDWNGSWYWQPGSCTTAQAGYSYVPPSYSGGYYVRGHWGQGGGGYVPPPPPAGGGYEQPQPAYGGGGYVPPPPPAGGGYAQPQPQPQPYVPPPPPAYGNPNYVPPPPPAP